MELTQSKLKPRNNTRLLLSNLFGMAQKYIIQGTDLIFGDVQFHKHLVGKVPSSKEKIIKGGGFWHVYTHENQTKTIILYSTSQDFGTAFLNEFKKCVDAKNLFGIDLENVIDVYVTTHDYLDVAIEQYLTKFKFDERRFLYDMTPEKFLVSKGIDLKTTSLNCVIDGHMRQPNLCQLLEEFAQIKQSER